MPDLDPTLETLRSLLGRRVRHEDSVWVVVDVLADGPSLVLRDCEDHVALQRDQFGEPTRLVPRTVLLRVWEAETQQPTPEFLGLDIQGT
jgi:hypothetical protein